MTDIQITIAGRTLAEWAMFAREDTCLDRMVPSDWRMLVASHRDATEALARVTAERDGLLRVVSDNHVALHLAEAAEAKVARLEECLAVAMGGCDANAGFEHSPVSLPHDRGYTFCQRCGETLTKAVAKAASSAAVQRAAAIKEGGQ